MAEIVTVHRPSPVFLPSFVIKMHIESHCNIYSHVSFSSDPHVLLMIYLGSILGKHNTICK